MYANKCNCLFSIVLGTILGIIVGFLAYTTAIAGIVTALWISFGIGIGSLIILLIISFFSKERTKKCICNNGNCLAIGSIGIIITTIIALSVTITTGALFVAIILGLVALFLITTLLSILQILLCLINTNCSCRE